LASAVRLSDSLPVLLKRVELESPKFKISVLFSVPSLYLDPRNHCVPMHHLKYEKFGILVLPLLWKFDDPPFDMVGEVIECFRQIFKVGLPMHDRLFLMHVIIGYPVHPFISSSDSTKLNIMMDPAKLYLKGFIPEEPYMK
ncbi:hypothetical protein F5146DRAFT_898632, partial [Armillaria mellea]